MKCTRMLFVCKFLTALLLFGNASRTWNILLLRQYTTTAFTETYHFPIRLQRQRLRQRYFALNQLLSSRNDGSVDYYNASTTTIKTLSVPPINLTTTRTRYDRRNVMTTITMWWWTSFISANLMTNNAANAAFGLQLKSSSSSQQPKESLYSLSPFKNTTTLRTQQSLDTQLFPGNSISSGSTSGGTGSSSSSSTSSLTTDPELTVELCLLRLLPVKNKFFRKLQGTLESLTPVLRNAEYTIGSSGNTGTSASDPWMVITKSIQNNGINELDRKRTLLEPVFNQDEEDTIMQIYKAERFEILIESLRSTLVTIVDATQQRNRTAALKQQKAALLILSEMGELLVPKYPYQVPTEGRYSYLPRLLGRCTVTFTIRRQRSILGNISIIADGYMAPITAGNFVDLSIREFYTGLPIKFIKKRLGSGLNNFEVANLPILGSFNDGFYDPLTAKVRRLPIEIIRVGKGSGEPDLTYSQGLSSLSESLLQPSDNSRPLLSFKIPNLVAMNHPENKLNGASTEFFALQDDSVLEEKRFYFDGEYAPFGWIIDGYDVFRKIQANDVIDATYVSDFGKLNLVKLRRSSFSEVVQGSGESEIVVSNPNEDV